MKKRNIIILILSTLPLLGIVLIALISTKRITQKKLVVCTTTMLADAVRNITKGTNDTIEIKTVMGAGVDPHIYQAKPSDALCIAHADLMLHHGLHLEGKLSHILHTMSSHRPVYDVSDILTTDRFIYTTDGTIDPHIWHDVSVWKEIITYIEQILSNQFPTYATNFKKNTNAYLNTLTKLERWIGHAIQTIPKERRMLITAHDAFSYFGQAYDMKVIGIQGINTQSQVTVKNLQDIIQLIIQHNIGTIFLEHSTPERTIHAVTQTARLRGHPISIGTHLFSDSLDTPEKPAGTYVGMIKSNVTNIVHHLNSPPTQEKYCLYDR